MQLIVEQSYRGDAQPSDSGTAMTMSEGIELDFKLQGAIEQV